MDAGKGGVVKPLPRAHVGKTHSEILEIQKSEWVEWVKAPQHGATVLQIEQFTSLMEGIVSEVRDTPQRIIDAQPDWGLPSVSVFHNPAPVQPPPQIAYGNLTYSRSMATARLHQRDLATHRELAESEVIVAKVRKGEIVLTKNIPEGGSGEVEWWLGKAIDNVEEMRRCDAADETLRVQWMHPDYQRSTGHFGELVPVNDLNQCFTEWTLPRVQGGPKNRRNIEEVDRLSVVLIGVHLVRSGLVSVASQKAIASLNIGYTYDRTTRLSYNKRQARELGV